MNYTMAEQTVLLAEDDEALADLYAMYLDSHYNTKVAYNGKEALEKIDSSVDILLVDRHMPGYPGDDVLADVRADGWEGPIIFVTGMSPDATDEMLADGYLKKPVDREELVAAVEAHL